MNDFEWDADLYLAQMDPCYNCGPECQHWGGDGLCMLEIQMMADEHWVESHPALAWIRTQWEILCYRVKDIRTGFWEICCQCKQPERIFWQRVGDHSDCLPF